MEYYWGLLADKQRIEAFRRGIMQAVRPDDRVLEVGAGLGTYSFFAADAGARQVWGVEGDPIINVARAISRLNGYGDRVEFIDGWIPDVALPGRADVLIFEDFPIRFLEPRTHRLLQRVYDDYLVEGARVLPCAARLSVAPVLESPNTFGFPADTYGIDWSPCLEYLANTPMSVRIDPACLAAEPSIIANVPLKPAPDPAAMRGEATWTLSDEVTITGLAYWFDLEVVPGEWISNGPGAESSWGHLFLPLEEPLVTTPGAEIQAVVGPETAADGLPGWLRWEVSTPTTSSVGHQFKSAPASASDLARWSDSATLELNRAGRLQNTVLGLTDGTRSLRAISEELRALLGDSRDPEATIRVASELLEGKIERVDISRWTKGAGVNDR